MSILVTLLIILVIVVVAVIIIDKTFTGEVVAFAWVAKLIVGIIALIIVIGLLQGHSFL